MKEQMELFHVPPEIKIKKKKRRYWPYIFHLVILEQGGTEFHIYQGGYTLNQAKKLAAKDYNKDQGYCEDNFVNFSEDYEKKEVKR